MWVTALHLWKMTQPVEDRATGRQFYSGALTALTLHGATAKVYVHKQTTVLYPLKVHCNVASFDIFHYYLHAKCSFELTNCMPFPLPRPHCKKFFTQANT